MIEEAKLKIREEMDKSNDTYTKIIGKYVLEQIEINKKAAEDICSAKKTLLKSLDNVKEIAKGKAVNGCACMGDEEVFKIVREYFGIEAVQDKMIQVEVEGIKEDHNIHEPKKDNVINVDFNVSLEDLF